MIFHPEPWGRAFLPMKNDHIFQPGLKSTTNYVPSKSKGFLKQIQGTYDISYEDAEKLLAGSLRLNLVDLWIVAWWRVG